MMKGSKILYRTALLFFVLSLGGCVGSFVSGVEPNSVYTQDSRSGRVEEHSSVGSTPTQWVFEGVFIFGISLALVTAIAGMVVQGKEAERLERETELEKSQLFDKIKVMPSQDIFVEIMRLEMSQYKTPEDNFRLRLLEEEKWRRTEAARMRAAPTENQKSS